MSDKENTAVNVSVLDRNYQLACPAEEVDNLKAAAAHLDGQMRDLRKRNKSSNGEKLAVVAALNITSELLQTRHSKPSLASISEQLTSMEDKIREALEPAESTTEPSSAAISVDN